MAKVININKAAFTVNLDCHEAEVDERAISEYGSRDLYYDTYAEREDKDQEAKSKNKPVVRMARNIEHPNFKNITFDEAERELAAADIGDLIIRPSSKGFNHLTVTWKVYHNFYQHIDVLELGKESNYSLGTRLTIGKETFDDLDEIIARYVEPMAGIVRDLVGHRKFKSEPENVVEDQVRQEKRSHLNSNPYYFCVSTKFPGKFSIVYQISEKLKIEPVSFNPLGIRFRYEVSQREFKSLDDLTNWFKRHFNDAPPSQAQNTRTPHTNRNSHSSSHSSHYNASPAYRDRDRRR